MLLGSDYTEGVKGVGIVNAMELLQAFDMSKGVKHGLSRFKKWLDGIEVPEGVGGRRDSSDLTGPERLFDEKHKSARNRWTTPEGFPSDLVIHAYKSPVVNKSTERFSWGTPDVENLIKFCGRYIGWTAEETNKWLAPVVEKINTGYRQTRIDSYMRYEDSITFADVRSKRLRGVLQKNRRSTSTDADNERGDSKQKSKLSKRRRT